MKTIQTFALLILLFAAKTYCQEDVASEKAEASIPTETKVPENLAVILDGTVEPEGEKLDSQTDSSTLPTQEAPTENIEVNPPSPQKEEENPVKIPEIQESSSVASESDLSTESPKETTQTEAEGATLNESLPEVEVVISPDSPQKEEKNPVTILEESPEETTQIVDEVTILSESGPEVQAVNSPDSPQKEEEIPATIPEIQESSSVVPKSEPSTERPEGTPQSVNEGTTLSESGPKVQAEPESASEHQQSLETIICVCNCGVDSDLPQNCEEVSSETAIPENALPTESTKNDPLVPEIEKQAEDEKNGNIETEAPSEGEPSISTLESDTSIVNEESTEPIAVETETVATPEIENSEVTPTNSAPQEEIVNNESTTVTDDVAPSAVTESEQELNSETISNPQTESTEANQQVSSEQEPTTTIDPLEVPATTISPCTEVGDIPNPTNCRQFLSCSGNATNLDSEELQCPGRSAFNPLLRRCTRDLSPCVDEEPICLRTSSIANPNGENSSYYWCVPNLLGGFHKYHIQCAENEIFIPLLGRCWLENPQLGLGLGFGLINREPSDRDLVRAEWKLLRREIKQTAREEKLRKKIEEKAKARAEKLAAKELKKQQKEAVRKVDDDTDETEENDD